jgi:hypothetical protein
MINILAHDSLELCKGDPVVTYTSLIVFSHFPKAAVIAITATDAMLMELGSGLRIPLIANRVTQ